ncbi:MAG TPA: ATP-binding cassette domain-containing protein [Clostridia bacterium]|nr:ATP-binding cassette domain-containing protein [Clostridia bacterium]
MKREILRIENIITEEKGIRTLNDFFLNLYQGELLGVFVNNALEKKHLIDLIYGNVEVGRGRICYENRPVNYEDYVDMRKSRISLVQSTSKLIDDLTVADNIFVIRDKFGRYRIDKRVIFDQARNLLEELGLGISPRKIVYQLSGFEKTAVEIAKAYGLGAKIIILKDLSSYLSDSELSQLTGIINELKGNGISFIMIDSFTDILRQFSDRMFVMKNGRNVWTLKGEQINNDILKAYFCTHKHEISGSPEIRNTIALKFDHVSTGRLEPLSFEIHSGEMLSILDNDGSCIDEITKVLIGENNSYQGDIFVGDRLFKPRSPWEAVKKNLAFIVENPVEAMLFKDITAIDNLCFVSGNKINTFWLHSRYRSCCIDDYEGFFSKETLNSRTEALSVYDQQKLVYLKWHLYNPRIVVCARPFSSIDVELREITSEMMRLLMEKGVAILVLASNYSEIDGSGARMVLRPKECPI